MEGSIDSREEHNLRQSNGDYQIQPYADVVIFNPTETNEKTMSKHCFNKP